MASILLVDDDNALVESLQLLLRSAGYNVRTAADGLSGLRSALELPPDLVLLDIRMPVLDGFGLMAALRANESTRRIPCVLLTGLDDRESLRKAMAFGVDGMLLKPVSVDALMQTIARRLEIAADGVGRVAAGPVTPRLASVPAHGSGGNLAELDAALGESSVRAPFKEPRRMSVLFSDVRNFSRLAEMLPSSDVADVLHDYYTRAHEVVSRQHGLVVRIIGDALLAAFESQPGTVEDHGVRAVRCGLLLREAAALYAASLESRYHQLSLPRFEVGTGVHTGEVMVCSMGPGRSSELTVIGDTVNVAAHLESLSKERGCNVVASATALAGAEERFLFGPREHMQLKGRIARIDAVEVLGFAPREDREGSGSNVVPLRMAI